MKHDNNYIELTSIKLKELVNNCIHNINENKRAQIKFNIDYARKVLTNKLNVWYRFFWKREPTNEEVKVLAKEIDQWNYRGTIMVSSYIDEAYEALEYLCFNLLNAAKYSDTVIVNVIDLARIT
jgi:hypothetical protein